MRLTIIFCLFILKVIPVFSQDQQITAKTRFNLPLITVVNFQNFALPLSDLNSNFTHPGISIGTEMKLNKKQSLIQQFQAGCYRNKEAGNGWMIYSQFTYRQKIYKGLFSEIKAGPGWQRVYHPVDAYRFKDGNWEKTKGGKSQLIFPIGISAGYTKRYTNFNLSPFVSTQLIPALFYNDVIPVHTYSLIQVGTIFSLN